MDFSLKLYSEILSPKISILGSKITISIYLPRVSPFLSIVWKNLLEWKLCDVTVVSNKMLRVRRVTKPKLYERVEDFTILWKISHHFYGALEALLRRKRFYVAFATLLQRFKKASEALPKRRKRDAKVFPVPISNYHSLPLIQLYYFNYPYNQTICCVFLVPV